MSDFDTLRGVKLFVYLSQTDLVFDYILLTQAFGIFSLLRIKFNIDFHR